MADRIAILGGEPYGEWIKRDGQAQRLYKAYHAKWPDSTTECAAIGDEFYVRFENGEMRHVDYVGDFDDEGEWCAQCGTPTREPLERTALRMYKRAGRPELCERYARIRYCIARDNA